MPWEAKAQRSYCCLDYFGVMGSKGPEAVLLLRIFSVPWEVKAQRRTLLRLSCGKRRPRGRTVAVLLLGVFFRCRGKQRPRGRTAAWIFSVSWEAKVQRPYFA